jgi:predicted molibdopterin-dependent oxidoreductase YjgC
VNDRDERASPEPISRAGPAIGREGATAGSRLHDVKIRWRHDVPKQYVRLTQPLVRDSKDAPLRPASWDEALSRVVAGFQAAKAAHGPTTFGVFSCSKATNEVNFAAQKFSRAVLGSNNIDSCNRT